MIEIYMILIVHTYIYTPYIHPGFWYLCTCQFRRKNTLILQQYNIFNNPLIQELITCCVLQVYTLIICILWLTFDLFKFMDTNFYMTCIKKSILWMLRICWFPPKARKKTKCTEKLISPTIYGMIFVSHMW